MSSIFFPFPPESPVTEKLVSLTDVLSLKSGQERRVSLRVAPRQELTYNYLLDEISERPLFENILFTAQNSVFSVPMWSDVSYTSSPITAGDTVINISTAVSDFRAGNNLALYAADGSLREICTILSFTASQITLTAGTANNWGTGIRVFPLQDCLVGSIIKSSRSPVGLVSYTIQWNVIDASINLATPFDPSYGNLGFGDDTFTFVVDDPNEIADTIQESNNMSIVLIDGNTGTFDNITYQAMARRGSVKSWLTNTRSSLWYKRKFLHQINGRLTSFFLPTFAHDTLAVANITSGSSTINVVNTGLTTYSGLGQGPRKYIRIEVPGTGFMYTASVASVSVISSTVEQITINGTWPDNIAYTAISRIGILERVRLASDTVTITHVDLIGNAKITCPVIAVLEGGDGTGTGTGPIKAPFPPAGPPIHSCCTFLGCSYSTLSTAAVTDGSGLLFSGVPFLNCADVNNPRVRWEGLATAGREPPLTNWVVQVHDDGSGNLVGYFAAVGVGPVDNMTKVTCNSFVVVSSGTTLTITDPVTC